MMQARMEGRKGSYSVLVAIPEEKRPLRRLVAYRTIILKWILEKWDGKAWIGFIWLSIRTCGRRLYIR
jgi:hypothetical protein